MVDEGWGSVGYVKVQFRRYYSTMAVSVEAPTDTNQREFGFLLFEGKAMLRHMSFKDVGELRRGISENIPAHVYYSSAYYSDPEAEMEWKGWLGADLVFDIDADHIDTPCKAEHDRWRCSSCGREGIGKVPETCQNCGKASFDEETWLCDRCLDMAKYEAQKLLDMLIGDFGFSPKDLRVNFSGNRGYHVHVKDPKVRMLDQLSRREIVDYAMGTGLRPEFHGFSSVHGGSPTLAEAGWRGRSTRALYDYLSGEKSESLEALKLSRTAMQSLTSKRDEILRIISDRHPSGLLRYIDIKSMNSIMEASIREQASAIDTVVTTDVHRLIRLPNTLHGKTGLLAQGIAMEELEDYDPLEEAVAFKGSTEKIYVRRSPSFRIDGELFGPFNEEAAELPLAAAMLLLCRRVARVEE